MTQQLLSNGVQVCTLSLFLRQITSKHVHSLSLTDTTHAHAFPDRSAQYLYLSMLRTIAPIALKLLAGAFETIRGVHDASWNELGYWFQTPEAYEASGNYRSLG